MNIFTGLFYGGRGWEIACDASRQYMGMGVPSVLLGNPAKFEIVWSLSGYRHPLLAQRQRLGETLGQLLPAEKQQPVLLHGRGASVGDNCWTPWVGMRYWLSDRLHCSFWPIWLNLEGSCRGVAAR